MAAHFYTYLQEALDLDKQGKFDKTQLRIFHEALSGAPLGDIPDFEDWNALYHTKFPSEFIEAAEKMLKKYRQLWFSLGGPKTYEEWTQRQKETSPCPLCDVEAVSAVRFKVRIWAGCGHCVVEKEEDNEPN